MKIYLRDIRPEGTQVRYEMPPEYTGLTKEDYLRFINPLEIDTFIELVDNTVLCKAKIKSVYRSFCSRCLAELEQDWENEYLLDFEVDRAMEFIELDEDIRQEVILSLPIRVLCDEDLKMESSSKGREKENLNEMSVRMEDKQKTQQPFAKLRLKNDK